MTRPPARPLLPSPADVVFILFLLVMPLARGWQALNTDGDLGRHLRVGQAMIAERELFHTDRFSFTAAGRPFVPYEWLSEVLFAGTHDVGGLAGVLVLVALVVAATYAALALFLNRSGVDPALAFFTAIVAGVSGAFHWLARPHVFTILGAVLLLWILERGGRRTPLLTGALFLVWANLHGGFLYGLVLIVVYVVADAMAPLGAGAREAPARELRRHALALGAALAAACLTPSGLALFPHVIGYLGKSYLVDRTAEYQSPDFHEWYGRVFLALLVAMLGALAWSRRRLPLPWLGVLLANTAFALNSARNIPLFAVTAVPLVAMHLDPAWRRVRLGTVARMRSAFARASEVAATGPWSAAAACAMLALAAGHGSIAGRALLPAAFDPAVFPVEAVREARTARLQGRIFNEFAWGGYLLYAWPEQKVFIDGQTDFYGEAITRSYTRIRGQEPGWREELDRWKIDLLLLPSSSALAAAALATNEWRVWHRDATAMVLVREGTSS